MWDASFTGGVIHGVALAASTAFAEPNSVLPSFVTALSPARWLVGAVSAMLIGGQVLLQVVFAYFLQGRARRQPYLLGAVFVRATSWAVLGAVVAGRPGLSHGAILALFFALVTLFSATGGLGGVAFTDVIGGAIPAENRGRFYGFRQTLGSVLAFGAGYAVRTILRPGFRPFPVNYGLLFLLSGLTLYIGVAGIAFIREEHRPQPLRPPFRRYIEQARGLLGSHARLRSLLYMQIAAGAAAMSLPFYIVFARQGLGLPAAVIGSVVAAQVAGSALSNVAWGALRDRYGSLNTVRLALGLDLLTPVVAVTLGTLAPTLFPALFFLVGVASSGRNLGFSNCLIDIAPAALRPTYAGLNGTLTSPTLLFPLVGGFLVGWAGFVPTFLLTSVLEIIPLAISLRLTPLGARQGD